MLRDVMTKITDGGLLGSPSGTGVHLKIGVSSVTSTEPIEIKGSMTAKRIQSKLGLSPLADACMDSIKGGASLIYCIPVTPSVEGTHSEVTKTGTGTGSMTVSGKPNNRYQVVVKIITPGALNTATMSYSLNGGVTYSDEMTIPTGGVVAISPTGLTLTFSGSGFAAGDSYTLTTTAPAMNNSDLLSAMGKIKQMKETIEFVHIVGETTKATWAAVATEAEALFKAHKPLFFMMEAPSPTVSQSAESYADTLMADRKGVNSIYLQVVSARGIYRRMDGTVQDVNLAGVLCGFYARASVQQSIGQTNAFNISDSDLLSLTPAGIEEYTSELDDSGYLTLRRYEGLVGYYVTNARMFAPVGSDYLYAERVRVSNKAVREVRKAMLVQLQTQVDVSNLDAELQSIAKFAEEPLDNMIRDQEISSARIIVPPDQDILATETLELIIRYVPVGYIRSIDIDLGMENPFGK